MFELNEKCGVFGVYGKGLDAGRLAFNGLLALQHRGQEASGIAITDGGRINLYGNAGLVTQVFNEALLDRLSGYLAIGHNRYSTSKGVGACAIQPVVEAGGTIAMAHNGNLPSTTALLNFLQSRTVNVSDKSDSELMAAALGFFVGEGLFIDEALKKAWPLFTGSFSLLLMDRNRLVAARDRCGIKPLSIARLNGGYVVSSETCSFSGLGATFFRDVVPGEMIVIDENGLRSVSLEDPNQKLDVFEFVYFANSASTLLGQSVYEARKRCGMELAKEANIKGDIVVPIPETAIPAAIGYSMQSGIPFEMGLIRNRYIYRTFIDPEAALRGRRVDMKLMPIPTVLAGKRVILLDDSIVRGTTSKKIVKKVFDAGAEEVHFVINSPPVRFPDFYGIDTPMQADLLAFDKTIDEMNAFLGSTSLHFLSYNGLIKGVGVPEDQLCTSCFTGKYPIDIQERKTEVQDLTV